MKVKVIKDVCIGCGMCVSICPDVYRMESDDKAHAIEGDVPPDLEDGAVEGKESCPVAAIE